MRYTLLLMFWFFSISLQAERIEISNVVLAGYFGQLNNYLTEAADRENSLYNDFFNYSDRTLVFDLRLTSIDSISLTDGETELLPYEHFGAYDFYRYSLNPGDSVRFYVNMPPNRAVSDFVYIGPDVSEWQRRQIRNGQSVQYRPWGIAQLGVFLFFGIVNLISFLMVRRADYGYYGIYLLLLFIKYFSQHVLMPYTESLGPQYYPYLSIITDVLQPLYQAAYLQFIRSFLSGHAKFPFLDRMLKWVVYASLVISMFMVLEFLTSFPIYRFSLNIFRIGSIVVGIWMIAYLYKRKNRLTKYVVYASISLLVGLTVAWVMIIFQLKFLGLYPLEIAQLGLTIEILFFTIGLADKTSLISQEKIALEVKSKHYEMDVLQLQMNPHFIFNSMNSLKRYVLRKETDNAVSHMDKMASLMQGILYGSRQEVILLAEELKNIQLYLDLENERIQQSITYSINVDDSVETAFTEVPPLLLQPFVENAIWHGLVPSDKTHKHIEIRLVESTNYLTIEIEDNGIGREMSNRKAAKSEQHQSLATELSKERIRIFNDDEDGLTIVDKKGATGEALGTLVVIKLKMG